MDLHEIPRKNSSSREQIRNWGGHCVRMDRENGREFTFKVLRKMTQTRHGRKIKTRFRICQNMSK